MSANQDRAEEAARGVLAEHWAEAHGWIDPFDISRNMGIEVYEADLSPDVSGTIIKQPTKPARIYVNRSDLEVRQRFSCAHELGHYASRREQGSANYAFEDRRDSGATLGRYPEEIYANAFAAELLVPAERVRVEVDRGRSVQQIARAFNVSTAVVANRCKRLNLSPDDMQWYS